MINRSARIGVALASSLLVAGCYTINGQSMDAKTDNGGSYCERNTAICVIAGVVIVGGVAGAIAAADRGKTSAPPVLTPSDSRLKEDIRPIGRLPNGIKLYAFRYRGDDRYFAGPIAQDLLKDARFRDAVSIESHGFYQVDLSALGLDVVNAAAMHAAGMHAAAEGAI